jgi:hypothetical protein
VSDWRAWFRTLLGVQQTPQSERDRVDEQLRKQYDRLRRIDAGLPPVERRHILLTEHPKRRVSDR